MGTCSLSFVATIGLCGCGEIWPFFIAAGMGWAKIEDLITGSVLWVEQSSPSLSFSLSWGVEGVTSSHSICSFGWPSVVCWQQDFNAHLPLQHLTTFLGIYVKKLKNCGISIWLLRRIILVNLLCALFDLLDVWGRIRTVHIDFRLAVNPTTTG